MSIETRRSRSTWVSVSPAPDYGDVVATYASAFLAAQIAQEDTEIATKVFNYQQGLIGYDEVISFINGKIATQVPGSARELSLREQLLEVETYETDKNRRIERAKLEAKYYKDGISAEESRIIEEAMLTYYKEGSPEYYEQLANIEKAKDLEEQEADNKELAELESQLSEGGLTISEQIEIYEKAKDLSEEGSEEWFSYQSKISSLTEENEKNTKLSDLLDQYVSGGLTTDEQLTINREMQALVERGTPEYNELKLQEGQLLGTQGGGAGDDYLGTGYSSAEAGATKNQTITELERIQTDLAALEEKFTSGLITDTEYLGGRKGLVEEENKLYLGLGDLLATDRTLSRAYGEFQSEMQDYQTQEQLYSTGEAVTLKDVTGRQGIVPIAEAANYAEEADVLGNQVDAEGNIISENTLQRAPVITTNMDGFEKKFAVTEDNKFELLQDREGQLVKTGLKLDKIVTKRDTAEEEGRRVQATNLLKPEPSIGTRALAAAKQTLTEKPKRDIARVTAAAKKIKLPKGEELAKRGIKSVAKATLGPAGLLGANLLKSKKLQAQGKTVIKNLTGKFRPAVDFGKKFFNKGKNLASRIFSLFG